MRLALALAVPLILAAPAAHAGPCSVTISRAPDDVRVVIEAWVRAEPRCAESLEVRVVPSEGGYYLYARDSAGRVHERDVPDAQTIGVLVASWIADDSLVAGPRPTPIAEQARSIEMAPGATPALIGERPSTPDGRGLAISLAATTSIVMGAALRADVELPRGDWFAYAAGTIGRTPVLVDNGLALYPLDARLAAGVGHAWGTGTWQLRARLGISFARWTADTGAMPIDATFVGGESAALVTRRLNARWAFTGGVEVKRFASHTDRTDALVISAPPLELGALAGLRVRL